MGIKTWKKSFNAASSTDSEKPPHHMGIKTLILAEMEGIVLSLKNLPTTWGLRLNQTIDFCQCVNSEKPPHHMGIKTF